MRNALVAEFIGTFILIFVGAGAGAINGNLLVVAFAHGLVVLGLVYAYGHLSGTHINPAVTIGLWVSGAIDATRAVGYVVVQLLGGIAGALALRFVLGGADSGLGATLLAEGVSPAQGFVVEFLLTFCLVNTILFTAVRGDDHGTAGLAIGMTLVFCILMGGPLTGASLNPARTLGPIAAGAPMAHLWLYFVAPISGGVAAAALYRAVSSRPS
ncbi:MAG: aquaporin [Acidobacteriota bacterium]